MDGLPGKAARPWRGRVGDLLDDPVVQAVLRRDGLTRDRVMAALEPVAEALARQVGGREAAP